MGRESLSDNSKAIPNLWGLMPNPLGKSVPSLVPVTQNLPFSKAIQCSQFCMQHLNRIQVLLRLVGWFDLWQQRNRLSASFWVRNINSQINCDRKCSPCQTPCIVLSLGVKFKENVNSLCSLRNLQLPCAGSHDIEFPKTPILFPFLVSCSNLVFPGFLLSVHMGFGSSDF